VPAQAEIEVTLTSKDDGAMATMDGQVGVSISQGDTIEIKMSDHRTRLIRFPETRYYEVLREKLKWGTAKNGSVYVDLPLARSITFSIS